MDGVVTSIRLMISSFLCTIWLPHSSLWAIMGQPHSPDVYHCNFSQFSTQRSLGFPHIVATLFLWGFPHIVATFFHWKMRFNLDRSKQAQEIIFYWKFKKTANPPFGFNINNASQANSRGHLGFSLVLNQLLIRTMIMH